MDRHGVAFVVIGGVAARLHGSPSVTIHVDVCYVWRGDNLELLAEALGELGRSSLRGVDEGVPFLLDDRTDVGRRFQLIFVTVAAAGHSM